MVSQGIANRIAAAEPELVELTGALVRIPTENPPGAEYDRCREAIAELLESRGFEVEDLGGAGCLRSFVGTGKRTLYFHGHYDVVPAERREQFRPEVCNGAVYGRGSADMKGGLAAMIVAAAALREAGLTDDGRVGLVFVPDEETGGAGGSAWLAGRGLLGEDAVGMLSPEPTGGVVWNASRGALSLRVTVHGKGAHVGLSHEGENAFERMLVVAERLRELGRELAERVTGLALEPPAARRSILLLGGEASAGRNFNVVPDRCSFTIDRRFNPEEDLEEERGRLLGVFDELRAEGIDLDVEVIQEARAAGVPANTEVAVALARAVEAVEGRAPRFELCPGLLEIRFYAQAGVPAYCYGPGRLDLAHGPDEHVDIDALRRCAEVYARTALDVLL